MRTAIRIGLVLGALLLVPTAARADRCKIDSVGSIAFGQYNLFATTPTDAAGSIGYSCSATPGPVISLSPGASGTFNMRTMLLGSSTLQYNVYVDATCKTIFGDGTGATAVFNAANSRWQVVTFYGRIFPGQTVPAGTYSDSLVATLNF